jgi:hypothetical protein
MFVTDDDAMDDESAALNDPTATVDNDDDDDPDDDLPIGGGTGIDDESMNDADTMASTALRKYLFYCIYSDHYYSR